MLDDNSPQYGKFVCTNIVEKRLTNGKKAVIGQSGLQRTQKERSSDGNICRLFLLLIFPLLLPLLDDDDPDAGSDAAQLLALSTSILTTGTYF